MFCPKCGKELADGSAFCGECGAKVARSAVGSEAIPGSTVTGSVGAGQAGVLGQNKPLQNKKGLIIGIAAAVVVVIVAIVVIYNVFFAPYAIDEKHFPDAAFRSVIAGQADLDRDGALSKDELAAVQSLTITGASSVEGLNVFPNLHSITLEGDALSKADLQGCGELKTVTAKNCPGLAELNIASSNKLEAIDITGSPVATLDLSGKSSLTTILCDNSVALEKLDDTPLHEYWVVENFKSDGSITPAAYTYDVKATYDTRGNLVKLVSDNAKYGTDTYTYAYDDQDRCIETKQKSSRSEEATWKIAYNDKGLLSEAAATVNAFGMSGPGSSETVTYNDQNLPLTHDYIVSQGGASKMNFSYDGKGALASIAKMSADEATYSITNDDAGRMTSITETPSTSTNGPTTFNISYDESGRIAKVAKSSRYGSCEKTFSYDEQGRLSDATNRNTPTGESLKNQLADISSAKFEYDANGLLTKVTPSRAGTGAVQGYSLGYKRLLIERDTAPNFNFVDLSNPLEPHLNHMFWSMKEYLQLDNLAYQGSISNIMAKVSPIAKEG